MWAGLVSHIQDKSVELWRLQEQIELTGQGGKN